MSENRGQGLRGMRHCSGAEERLQCVDGVLFRFQLPVSLFENEALFFDPSPPALSTHPLPCVNHSGRETYREEGRKKNAFQTDVCNGLNICMTEHLLDKCSEAFQRPGNIQSNYLCIAEAQCFLQYWIYSAYSCNFSHTAVELFKIIYFVSQFIISDYNIF